MRDTRAWHTRLARTLALLPPVLAVLQRWKAGQKVRRLTDDRLFPVCIQDVPKT